MKKQIYIVMILAIFLGGCMKDSNDNTKMDTQNYAETQNKPRETIPGEFYVGFKKGVSKSEAELILNSFNLSFTHVDKPVPPQKFFYEAGEKFLIKVDESQVTKWQDKLEENKSVYMTVPHFNPDVIDID